VKSKELIEIMMRVLVSLYAQNDENLTHFNTTRKTAEFKPEQTFNLTSYQVFSTCHLNGQILQFKR